MSLNLTNNTFKVLSELNLRQMILKPFFWTENK